MTVKQVRKYYAEGDIKNALKGASEHYDLLGVCNAKQAKLAYECIVHPEFYKQLNTDLDFEIMLGKGILAKYYGNKPKEEKK